MSKDRTIAKVRTNPDYARCAALLNLHGIPFTVQGKGASGGNAKHPRLVMRIADAQVSFTIPCSPKRSGNAARVVESNLRRLLRQHGVEA